MSTESVLSPSGATTILPLGIDFGVLEAFSTGKFPLTSVFAKVGTGGAANMAYRGAGAGNVLGAPTITNSNFVINTPGTDYVDTGILDTGGDYTAFVIIQNGNTAAAPTWMAFGTFGTNTTSPAPGVSGIYFEANSATSVRLHDNTYNGSTLVNVNLTLTVANLQTTPHLFCLQRGSSGGTMTLNIYNITDSGFVAPAATTTSPYPIDPNLQNTLEIGRAPINGGDGAAQGVCSIPLFSLYTSAIGGGAFMSPAQIGVVAGYHKRWLAALPSPPYAV